MRDKKAFRISSFLPYVLGFFLAVGVFYVVKYTEFFEANLLSIVEQDYFKKQDWDIAYKTYDGVLDVYVAEDLQWDKIDIVVYFDESVVFDFGQLETALPSYITGSQDAGMWIFSASLADIENRTESLFVLPFDGESSEVIVGEAYVDQKGLFVGSLPVLTDVHGQK